MRIAEYLIAVIAGLSMFGLTAGLVALSIVVGSPILIVVLLTVMATLSMVAYIGLMRMAVKG